MSSDHLVNNTSPLVSIVLCAYNGACYIRNQLDTIVNQTYDNIEVIISDDRSTDSTLLVIEEFCQKYDFIRLYRNEYNLGLVKNFEKAIQLARGEYIALADQDDVWHLSKIKDLIENIGENILIYHNSSFIDYDGKKLTNETMATRNVMYDGRSCLPFIYSNCVSGHAMLFKRELVPFIIPFDKRFFHDWWIVYASLNKGSIKYLDKVLVQYRQHGRNVTDPLRINTSHPRIKDFPVSEEWAAYCASYPYNDDSALVRSVYQVISNVYKRKKKVKSFLFLLKYFNLFFYIDNPPSRLWERIRIVKKIVLKKR